MSAQYFSEINLKDIIDHSRDEFFKLGEFEDKLSILKSASQFYLNPISDVYIEQREKPNIDTYLNTSQVILNQLVEARNNNPEGFAANKATWTQQFNANYDELLSRLIRPYLAYSASQDPNNRIQKLDALITDAERNAQLYEKRASDQANATAASARGTIGEHFESLLDDGKRVGSRIPRITAGQDERGVYISLKRATNGPTGLNGGLNYSARRWLLASIFLLMVAVFLVAWIFKRHFDGNVTGLSTDDLEKRALAAIPKILALIVVLLPLRFAIKNYNAASHLRTIYRHKAVAIRTVEGYVANMDAPNQNEVRKLIAIEVFQTPETGYISRKDGAGSSEVPMEYMLGKISRD